MDESDLQEMTHGALRNEVVRLLHSGESLYQMLEFEERRNKRLWEQYRELYCAVWQMPLDEFPCGETAHQECVDEANKQSREVTRLMKRLAEIKAHWQGGVAELDTPWRERMEELIEWEGLIE